jgi:hypothetical protein
MRSGMNKSHRQNPPDTIKSRNTARSATKSLRSAATLTIMQIEGQLQQQSYRLLLITHRKHMLTHTRPFKCDVSGCDNHNGFASPHDLARHKKTCHSMLTVKTSKFYYRCAAPSCQKKDKIWPRKDNFKAHLEGTHRYGEAEVAELLVKYVNCVGP